MPLEISRELSPLPAMLRQTVEQYPDRPALVFMNRRMSYAELGREVEALASALAGLGVERGTKVAILLPNLPQTVIAYHAVLALGASVVMTNPLYVERELEHQWRDADCRFAVVADYLFDQRIQGSRDALPIEHYIVTGIPDYLRFPLNYLAAFKLRRADPPLRASVTPGPGVHRLADLMGRPHARRPIVTVALGDVAVLQYTGGTTGVSKGAMLTHGNLASNVEQIRLWFTTMQAGAEVVLACLPLFHVFGMTVSMNFALAIGASIVLIPDPRDVPRIIASITKERVTLFPAVPALFNAINNYPGVDDLDLGSVKACVSGSAPLPADVRRRFEALSDSAIMEGFGLTETSPVTHCNPLRGTHKDGSIGIPLPSTDARIVSADDATQVRAPGEEGELLIRGPQVMKGYWKRPDATADTMSGDWLKTGDMARMDEDGYFFIVGRKKDLIIASGYNVYPDEVDEVLVSHPAVVEAGTIGVPDERRGETVKSFVVIAAGELVSAEALIAYCRKELAAYKVPDEIEFRDELPKSAAMKILRRQLRDEELAKSRGD